MLADAVVTERKANSMTLRCDISSRDSRRCSISCFLILIL